MRVAGSKYSFSLPPNLEKEYCTLPKFKFTAKIVLVSEMQFLWLFCVIYKKRSNKIIDAPFVLVQRLF